MAVLYPVSRELETQSPGVPVRSDGETASPRTESVHPVLRWLTWLGMGLAVPPPEAFRMLVPSARAGALSGARRRSSLPARLISGGRVRGTRRPEDTEDPDSGAEPPGERPPADASPADPGPWPKVLAYLRGDKWLPQLVRFALVGGFSNIGYFLLFLACYGGGAQLANFTGSVVSTALANELHRRLTFHAADRVGWFTAQLEGGGLALAGLALTSASLAVLDFLAPGLSDVGEALAVIVITVAVGTLRFLTLRLWVF